jgi:glycine cleavage system H protein
MTEKPFELKVDKWTFRVSRDRLYTENDTWVKVDDDVATVGVTDFIQNKAGDIVYVQNLDIGTVVEQFDEAGSFESVKTVLDVISPVSGTIVEANSRLESEPELMNKDPYGEGWVLKIKVKDFEADKGNLASPEDYFEILKRKVETERLSLKKKKEEPQKE